MHNMFRTDPCPQQPFGREFHTHTHTHMYIYKTKNCVQLRKDRKLIKTPPTTIILCLEIIVQKTLNKLLLFSNNCIGLKEENAR